MTDPTASEAGLIVTYPEPEVAVITLARPARLNAITFEMFGALENACDRIDVDEAVRAVIVTGEGRAFCAGLDLAAAAELGAMTVAENLHGQELWARSITRLNTLSKPVIAAVNGVAAGAGFALALAADVRLAAPTARFNAAFVRIGLSGGDCGTSYFLPRIVGTGHAYELLFTGRFVEADEAVRIGLVNVVVTADDLISRSIDMARAIALNSPVGVHLTKQLVRTNVDAPSLAAALELENRSQVLTARTADMQEALTAFREKRAANFVGH